MYKIYLRIFLQEKIRYKSIKWNSQKLKRKISKTIEQNLCPCPCFKNASLFIHRKKQLGLRVQHSRVLFSCWSREHTRNVWNVQWNVYLYGVILKMIQRIALSLRVHSTLKISNKNIYIILFSYRWRIFY